MVHRSRNADEHLTRYEYTYTLHPERHTIQLALTSGFANTLGELPWRYLQSRLLRQIDDSDRRSRRATSLGGAPWRTEPERNNSTIRKYEPHDQCNQRHIANIAHH